MSTINIDADTVAQCALTIKNEAPDQHTTLTSCHQDLFDMVGERIWEGDTAETVTGEFYNTILCLYAHSDQKSLNLYAHCLKGATDNYTLAEATNKNMAQIFSNV